MLLLYNAVRPAFTFALLTLKGQAWATSLPVFTFALMIACAFSPPSSCVDDSIVHWGRLTSNCYQANIVHADCLSASAGL